MQRAIVVTLLLLVGCATPHWTKPGASQDEFARDKWTCLEHARSLNDNKTWSGGFTEASIFKQCMADHGWHAD